MHADGVPRQYGDRTMGGYADPHAGYAQPAQMSLGEAYLADTLNNRDDRWKQELGTMRTTKPPADFRDAANRSQQSRRSFKNQN